METIKDWSGKEVKLPKVSGKVIDRRNDLAYPLLLIKQGRRYAVVYGLDVTEGLESEDAAEVYFGCLCHALSLFGKD